MWNFKGTNAAGGKVVLADWDHIALNGRTVIICFDSDVMHKPSVNQALTRLKAILELRKAKVSIIYLPAAADGSKVGLDDFLAAGHTTEELFHLATSALRPSAADDGVHAEGSSKKSQATRCVELAREQCELWHAGQDAYATIRLAAHVEHHPVKDAQFRRWLARSMYAATKTSVSETTIRDACITLAGIATYDGAEHPVGVRVAVRSQRPWRVAMAQRPSPPSPSAQPGTSMTLLGRVLLEFDHGLTTWFPKEHVRPVRGQDAYESARSNMPAFLDDLIAMPPAKRIGALKRVLEINKSSSDAISVGKGWVSFHGLRWAALLRLVPAPRRSSFSRRSWHRRGKRWLS